MLPEQALLAAELLVLLADEMMDKCDMPARESMKHCLKGKYSMPLAAYPNPHEISDYKKDVKRYNNCMFDSIKSLQQASYRLDADAKTKEVFIYRFLKQIVDSMRDRIRTHNRFASMYLDCIDDGFYGAYGIEGADYDKEAYTNLFNEVKEWEKFK